MNNMLTQIAKKENKKNKVDKRKDTELSDKNRIYQTHSARGT